MIAKPWATLMDAFRAGPKSFAIGMTAFGVAASVVLAGAGGRFSASGLLLLLLLWVPIGAAMARSLASCSVRSRS